MFPLLLIAIAIIAISGTAYASSNNNDSNDTVDSVWLNYDSLFKLYANVYKIPARWLKGIALNESSLGTNPLVKAGKVSSDGLSYGIMQLQISTASDYTDKLVTPSELNNPEFSIKIAAMHLSRLKILFSNNEENVIRAYNEGEGKRKKVLAGTTTSTKINIDYWARYQKWVIYMEKKGGIV